MSAQSLDDLHTLEPLTPPSTDLFAENATPPLHQHLPSFERTCLECDDLVEYCLTFALSQKDLPKLALVNRTFRRALQQPHVIFHLLIDIFRSAFDSTPTAFADPKIMDLWENFASRFSSLEFSHTPKLTFDLFQQLLNSTPHLQTLAFAGCDHLSDQSLNSLGRLCPKLRILKLTWDGQCCPLTPESTQAIGFHRQILHSLDLSEQRHLTKAAFLEILGSDPLLNLLSLKLAYCRALKKEDLALIPLHCPNLHSLDLYHCPAATHDTLITIAEGCPLLRELDLSGLPIKDETVIALASRIPLLETLTLASCKNLSDEAILTVFKLSGSLRHLDCSFVGIIETSFRYAAVAPSLRSLQLTGCTAVTDNLLKDLGNCCPGLLSLTLTHCPELTPKCIDLIAANWPMLQNLSISESAILSRKEINRLQNTLPKVVLKFFLN